MLEQLRAIIIFREKSESNFSESFGVEGGGGRVDVVVIGLKQFMTQV